MSSDDLTGKQSNAGDDNQETQPTITAVFRLIQDVESRLTVRLDGINARIDAVESRLAHDIEAGESRLAHDIEAVNTRVTQGFKELTHKTNALNRRALQQEADYEDLSERVEHLESNAS